MSLAPGSGVKAPAGSWPVWSWRTSILNPDGSLTSNGSSPGIPCAISGAYELFKSRGEVSLTKSGNNDGQKLDQSCSSNEIVSGVVWGTVLPKSGNGVGADLVEQQPP